MQKNSNPEEFESSPSFIGKSFKNKLKSVSPKEISHYCISKFLF